MLIVMPGLDVYNACGHLWPGTVRLGRSAHFTSYPTNDDADLKFRLVVRMSIVGLVNLPEASTQLSNIACPFELPANSV